MQKRVCAGVTMLYQKKGQMRAYLTIMNWLYKPAEEIDSAVQVMVAKHELQLPFMDDI